MRAAANCVAPAHAARPGPWCIVLLRNHLRSQPHVAAAWVLALAEPPPQRVDRQAACRQQANSSRHNTLAGAMHSTALAHTWVNHTPHSRFGQALLRSGGPPVPRRIREDLSGAARCTQYNHLRAKLSAFARSMPTGAGCLPQCIDASYAAHFPTLSCAEQRQHCCNNHYSRCKLGSSGTACARCGAQHTAGRDRKNEHRLGYLLRCHLLSQLGTKRRSQPTCVG